MGLSTSSFIVSTLLASLFFSFKGVAGVLSGIPSSFGRGEVGRLTDGVESAVPRVVVFLVFFFRPIMGA